VSEVDAPSARINEALQFEAIVAEALERVMSFHPKEARAGVLRRLREELAQCLAEATATDTSPEAADLRVRLASLFEGEGRDPGTG